MKIKQAIETLRKATANCAIGDRHIVVLDRGFIFAGNLSFDETTKIYTLTDAKNVRRWEKGGFGGLTHSAKESKAELDSSEPINFHRSAIIFFVPITEDWDDC